jgi:hypothetical protein
MFTIESLKGASEKRTTQIIKSKGHTIKGDYNLRPLRDFK